MSDEKIIDRINKLLALAMDQGATEAERALAQERADKLILQNAIDRAALNSDPARRQTEQILVEHWEVPYTEFYESVRQLVAVVLDHCNLRATFRGYSGKLEVIGYEADIKYGEMLWLTVYREMAANLFPTWKTDLSFDENVYNFVKGGYKWEAIYREAVKHISELKWPSGRYKASYVRECKRRGEVATPHTQRHSAYRTSYAQSFSSTIYGRLRAMRKRSEQEVVQDSDRYALAVKSNKAKVDEEFYRLYPQYDPERIARQQAQHAAEEEARRAAMTEAQRKAEDEKRRKQEDRDRAYYDKMRNKEYDPNGWDRGNKVAESIDLSMGKNHVTPRRNEVE